VEPHRGANAEVCRILGVGNNTFGQLGTGGTLNALAPIATVIPYTVTAWAQVSAGYYQTCGIASTGSAMCWGACRECRGWRGLRGSLSHSTHVAGVVYAASDQ
jgi:hypothetical protein